MLIPTDYTPVQIIVPDDKDCHTIYTIWTNIYLTNRDTYSYISHLSLARKYNLIYALIKTDNLNPLKYPYTEVPLISAENINFYKLNKYYNLILKEENDILEMTNMHGTQFWYKNNNLHRDNDLPALISTNGTQEWYQNSNLHRDNDLPAVIFNNGTQEWYKNGLRHRDNNLPAIINLNGSQEWYKDGKIHRDNDLPALIWKDGRKEWFKHGVRYDYPS